MAAGGFDRSVPDCDRNAMIPTEPIGSLSRPPALIEAVDPSELIATVASVAGRVDDQS
jgi:hypothetical protein